MERKSKFRHLHGGHPRNANPYSFYRQQMRRIKYPFIGASVLLFFFLSFQGVGEFSKTDVLSGIPKEKVVITSENLEVAKKGLLLILNEEQKECESLKLSDCVLEVKNLINIVAAVKTAEEANNLYVSFEQAVAEWDEVQQKESCKRDYETSVKNLEKTIRLLRKNNPKQADELRSSLEDLKNSFSCS